LRSALVFGRISNSIAELDRADEVKVEEGATEEDIPLWAPAHGGGGDEASEEPVIKGLFELVKSMLAYDPALRPTPHQIVLQANAWLAALEEEHP